MNLESTKQRAKAFDYLFDAVVIVDLTGVITDWNIGSEKLYGYTKEEVLGKPVSILHVPEDIESITKEVMSSVEKTGKWTGEVKMLHKDGHIGWIESMCVPFFDSNDEVIGSLGINRDITKRIQNELELKNKQLELEREVEIKNRFFSIIAHDLNGPFTQLLGFTKMLSEKIDNFSKDQIVNMANSVNDAAHRVFNLQKNLLQWSRLQFSDGKVIPLALVLSELVEETFEVYKTIAENKKIKLTNQIIETNIFADKDMVQTILRNLISNSLKFSHEGSEITVSSRKIENMVEVTVGDGGVGISRDKLKKLFTLGNEAIDKPTAGELGTGMGMNLCKEMVEENGGSITVNSTVGEGTQVQFNLPSESN
jgi:PAS domain S-box-containing protein